MRINELLEAKKFDDSDFVKDKEGSREIDYDLTEDLVFFMNNDDDMYRRHVYPSISKCISSVKQNRDIAPSIFQDAVREGYKNYIEQFPIRELPESIDDKQLREVCKKMVEEFKSHHNDGKYKD